MQKKKDKKKSFKDIYKYGNIITGKYYIFRYLANDLYLNRLGIIIRKKNGNSVKRNYEKRVIREFFRCQLIKSNTDILCIVKETYGSFLDKKQDFDNLYLKIMNNE